ncbi:MAG: hypothetical protein DRI72_09785 [Bacteroidetes bacterium]|nr:MAG: hypothetical protein DRI72_09785 [Bacteroidota bacterium]
MNNIKFLWLTVVLSVLFLSGFSQTAEEMTYIDGEVMVQLKNKQSIDKLVGAYDFFQNNKEDVQVISERFHIYLLRFDGLKTTNRQVLSELRLHPEVINAQNNHFIELRDGDELIPDDTRFDEQWSMKNTGQNGGVPDADIDATDAWEITTGGLTVFGDTIVVAVVDGGAFLTHDDLDFWKNRNEIPGNGIDDDENGYVDDYDGWNAYQHNGNVPTTSSHGTHVSGIIGAIGNNDLGVAGVNWQVKILPVAASSTSESVVVEGLSYVYVVREQYDLSNGAEGAFVVADNCSFGVDHGQPENFPIWEAMYDSLGRLGVISCAATANANWDIDEEGDVPTAFTTDYMISVTNTTNLDAKRTSAGYGLTTIDLGAPGTSILSTVTNNTYGLKTGTSMATPHVTGAVAFMYSVADTSFMDFYNNNPGDGALLIKEYILNGTDTLLTLVGKTVTGGRLNLNKSALLLLDRPDLTVIPDSFYVELLINTTTADTLTVVNTGSDTLHYTIDIPDQPGWISLSQTAGTLAESEFDDIRVSFDNNGLDTGDYHCQIVVDAGEVGADTVPVTLFVYTDVGIREQNDVLSEFHVYPNPFSSTVIYLDFTSGESGILKLDIMDQAGKIIRYQKLKIARGTNHMALKDLHMASGVYFYRLMLHDKTVRSGKLIRK